MECYICHKLIERHEYTRHVGSHLAANVTEMHLQPDDSADYGHPGTAFPARSTSPRLQEHTHRLRPATPNVQPQSSDLGDSLVRLASSHTPVRSTAVSDRAPQQEAPGRQPTELNAFQSWLMNHARDFPKYTVIDGQKSYSDLQGFRDAAELLRGTTKEEVVKIVKEFEGFQGSSEEQKTCLELVRKAPIFSGLVAYTYMHLIMCPSRGWLGWVYNDDWSGQVSELKQLVERWSKCNDVWCILFCDTIKEGLLKVLRAAKVRPEEHRCNPGLLNGTTVLKCDILNLAALAALCVTGSWRKDSLDQPGVQVGKLIELFHDLLESNVELEECYRRCFLNALIPLSKGSGCCPRGIYITECTISGLGLESQGGYGLVYKGRLGSRLVAVKALKRDNSMKFSDYSKKLSKEAIVWRYLRHPNCLPLYGVYVMPKGPSISFALVSPWMEEGTLSDYLKRKPEANRTMLILDVVRGLTYLHTMEPHVAHRDIKPDNILITRKGHACLADFGLVSTFDTADHLHTAASEVEMGGTLNFVAPEIFSAEGSEKRRLVNKRECDMYALGCTIYAAYTGSRPFEGMPLHQLCANVMNGRRPEFPVDGKIPHDMWSFIENLWDHEPSKRLTAETALDWMVVKASHEGVDSSLGSLGEEEWDWKRQPDDKSLWSVSL